jgi:hypothetical protein
MNNIEQRRHAVRVSFKSASQTAIRPTTEEDWEILKAIRLASLLDAPTAFGLSQATAAGYSDSQWRDRASGRSPAEYH